VLLRTSGLTREGLIDQMRMAACEEVNRGMAFSLMLLKNCFEMGII
jgi:hypothetical protein